jgi:transcriptional regulator
MTLYTPPHFKIEDEAELLAFMQRYAFGTLVSSSAADPHAGHIHASHIPFICEKGADGRIRLQGHVARANEHWKALEQASHVLAIFQGPHAYVSPAWYEQQPSVPTWNYAVVHAHGKARLTDEAELHDLLIRLSNTYEAGRPKPWRAADLPAAYVSSMLAHIVGFEIEVERLEGKFKLSQNRPAETARVIDALERDGEAGVAQLMRDHPTPAKG